MNHRRAVGDIVKISIRIEQQVRWIHDPHAPAPAQRGVGHVESVLKHLVPIEFPVAVGVLVNRDQVRPAVMIWRWWRHAIVDGAIVGIAAHHLDPGRIRILPVLRDPGATALVEAEMRALRDERFGENQINREIVGGLQFRERLRGPEFRTRDELLGARQNPTRAAELRERRAGRLLRERTARRVAIAREKFPRALEHTLEIVGHDRRCLAKETAWAGAVVDADGDLVPLILLERADRDLVRVAIGAAALEGRRETSA